MVGPSEQQAARHIRKINGAMTRRSFSSSLFFPRLSAVEKLVNILTSWELSMRITTILLAGALTGAAITNGIGTANAQYY